MFFFSLGIDNSPQERRCHAAHYVSKAKKEFLMSSPKSIGKKYHQIFDNTLSMVAFKNDYLNNQDSDFSRFVY